MNRYDLGNYSYVADSSFRPFTFDEMIKPLALYGTAYKEVENDLVNLSKADKFKYLDSTISPDDPARQIYDNYASELKTYADDLAANGLTINNRKGILNLKARYAGEIGQLFDAEAKREEEMKLRNALRAKGINMLYANYTPQISDYLGGRTPDTYGVSLEDLRKRGLEEGQSASSRIYGNTKISNLTRQYQEIFQSQGYNPQTVAAFRKDLEAIPELRQAVDDIMKEYAVDEHLSVTDQNRAKQSVINGIINGLGYKESRSIKENGEYMNAAQRAADARQKDSTALSAALHGYEKIGGKWVRTAPAVNTPGNTRSNSSLSSSGSSKGSVRYPVYTKPTIISGNGTSFVDDGSEDSKKAINKLRSKSSRVRIKNSKDAMRKEVYLTNGNTEVKIGSVNKNIDGTWAPKVESGIFKYDRQDALSELFGRYNSALNNNVALNLLNDLADRMEEEGEDGYKNYDYYFYPKGAGKVADTNGVTAYGALLRDPKSREMPTIYNSQGQLDYSDMSYGSDD